LERRQQQQMKAMAQKAENELQKSAAFWGERARALRVRAEASEARAAALEEQLVARSATAERELQATAAFWVARVAALEARLTGAAEGGAA